MEAKGTGLLADGPRRRIIAKLEVKGPNVVKGLHLEGLRTVGVPEVLSREYNLQGIDEIMFIDTVASLYGRNNSFDIVKKTAEQIFIPLGLGGGIKTLNDVELALRSGADKVAVNSQGVRNKNFLREIERNFGSQCLVAHLDVKKKNGSWVVLIDNAREVTDLDAVEWAREVEGLGAGEIFVTSVDKDGTMKGADVELIQSISSAVCIPFIYSGGIGRPSDVTDVFLKGGADAIAISAVLHFKKTTLKEIRDEVSSHAISIRLS